MQWILTISEPFSLADLLRSSAWLLLPPFGYGRSRGNLTRVEYLSSTQTISVTISQVSAGLVLHTPQKLGSQESEELSRRVWRILRLGENLQAFVETAANTPQLASAARQGARLIRGASLFEDVIRSICLTKESRYPSLSTVGRIVDTYGAPLLSNPTRHAFPTPSQIRQSNPSRLSPEVDRDTAETIFRLAEVFDSQNNRLRAMIESQLPTPVLSVELRNTLELAGPELDFLLLSLGRYDHIPVNFDALNSIKGQENAPVSSTQQNPRVLFAPWQPWGGLAYWLWDWSAVAEVGSPDNQQMT